MKYLLKKINTVINADHIVWVDYFPATEETAEDIATRSKVVITLTSIVPDDSGSISDTITLYSESADAFWEVYSGDAFAVSA